MKRAVHIGLRGGDIVLESSGDRFEHLVYQTERGVALKLGIHDYSHRVEVVYLVKALALIEHLAVDAVNRFYSSRKLKVNVVLAELLVNYASDVLDKSDALTVFIVDILLYLSVSDRVEVRDTEIFKLLLYLLHTEAVRERRVNVHSLKRRLSSLGVSLDRKSTHIVKSVAELDENNSDILGHREEHLAEILDMSLLLVLDIESYHLGKSVDEHRRFRSEFRLDLLEVGLIRAVLHGIVKERGTDRVGIKTEVGYYLCHRYGMRDIRLSADTELSLVKRLCVFSRHFYFFQIVFSSRITQLFHKLLYGKTGIRCHWVPFCRPSYCQARSTHCVLRRLRIADLSMLVLLARNITSKR